METLVNQTFLSYTTIHNFLCVETDQSIKESIELIIWVVFCPHDTTHSLNLLSSGFEVHAKLDCNVGTGEVDGCVTHPTQKYHINLIRCFE